MKNKKSVYVALPLVIGLWALVIYKVVQIYSSSDEAVIAQNSFVPPLLTSFITDTFSITADYRDPFLGKLQSKSETTNKPKAVPPTPKVKETLKWPVIAYGGMIKSRTSNEQVCAVSINGQSNFMKEGSVIADVLLKKVYKDSIEVVFQKEKRTIKK